MNIELKKNVSEVNKIGKTLTALQTISGDFRASTSILSPSFTVSGLLLTDLNNCNYCYIPDLARYYFITDIKVLRTNLFQLDMKVDVLETYKTQIKAQTAVIARQENVYNLYLDDNQFKVYQNPNIVTKSFPSGFTTMSFVLAVVGG